MLVNAMITARLGQGCKRKQNRRTDISDTLKKDIRKKG